MLPEGYGVDAPNVHGAPPERQRQLQDACALLAQNPSSRNDHLRPVMRLDPTPVFLMTKMQLALLQLSPRLRVSLLLMSARRMLQLLLFCLQWWVLYRL